MTGQQIFALCMLCLGGGGLLTFAVFTLIVARKTAKEQPVEKPKETEKESPRIQEYYGGLVQTETSKGSIITTMTPKGTEYLKSLSTVEALVSELSGLARAIRFDASLNIAGLGPMISAAEAYAFVMITQAYAESMKDRCSRKTQTE